MPDPDGCDISNIQGTMLRRRSVDPVELPRWMSDQGMRLFAAKSTQGSTYQDPFFHAWRAQAARLGFEFRGIYHWVSRTSSIDLQLANFVAWVGDLGEGECIQLDCEEAGLTEDQIVEAYEKWTGRYGGRVLVYLGRYAFGRLIDHHPEWPWWLPWYGPKSLPAGLPRQPVIWQWGGGGEGVSVPMLGGARIDSNQIIDEDRLRLLCGYPQRQPGGIPEGDDDLPYTEDQLRQMIREEAWAAVIGVLRSPEVKAIIHDAAATGASGPTAESP